MTVRTRRMAIRGPVYSAVRLATWDDVVQFARHHLGDHLFRGQGRAAYHLSSSLERLAQRGAPPLDHLRAIERPMLRQFQRRAHHYIQDPPPQNSYLAWLALMQHHGAPTRLLDFTHSFYVAAFFALEHAEEDAAVWAISSRALDAQVRPALGARVYKTMVEHGQRYVDAADAYLGGRDPTTLVFDVEPARLSERLAPQQGTFLFPADLRLPFAANLAATFGVSEDIFAQPAQSLDMGARTGENGAPAAITKIVIPLAARRDGLADLARMNISAASLFPGLDGFARSLAYKLTAWPWGR